MLYDLEGLGTRLPSFFYGGEGSGNQTNTCRPQALYTRQLHVEKDRVRKGLHIVISPDK